MRGRLSKNSAPMVATLLIAMTALAGCIQAPGEEQASPQSSPSTPDRTDADASECRAYADLHDDRAGQGPGNQAAISNHPGSFSYSGQVFLGQGTERFEWSNPSNGAMVSWGGQSATGSLTIRIYDACDTEVHAQEIMMLSQGGAFSMDIEGERGIWIIQIEKTLYTGQMGLQVNSG